MSSRIFAAKLLRMFLISNFRPALNAVCFLLGNSPASELYMPTFRNALSVPSSQADRYEECLVDECLAGLAEPNQPNLSPYKYRNIFPT